MKYLISPLLVCICCITAYSQNTKGLSVPKPASNNIINGKTYALIVGVSKYKNPAIPQLQYADRDAIAFRNYLVATGVDSNNITLLTNEQATNGAFWASISFLNDTSIVKKGDKVFIYFSGHGDVENRTVVKDAYLLPYDAPKCVYPVCAIGVLYLKSWIATLSANGIQAIFIADACHSGNLAGGREGMDAAATMLKENWQDEIKILSCQPGELSLEGKQWGGGRGLFSYELIRGMAGAADKNKDGKVTLHELSLYMMEMVPDEATPMPQNPALYGNMETIVSIVSPGLISNMNTSDNKMLAKVDVKGFEETLLAGLDDSIKYNYKMFKTTLDTGNYLSLDENAKLPFDKKDMLPCSYYYYLQVPDKNNTHLLVALMKREICSVIMNNGEDMINRYIQGTYTKGETKNRAINTGASMEACRSILGDKKSEQIGFMPKLLALEALGYESYSTGNAANNYGRGICILKIDSAMQFAPNAGYLYYMRARYKNDSTSVVDYRKTIQLSPKLVYAYEALATVYTANKAYDSALEMQRQLLVADSNLKCISWSCMAGIFAYMNKKDSAIYYIDKSLSVNRLYTHQNNTADNYSYFYSISYYVNAGAYAVMNDKVMATKFFELALINGYSNYKLIVNDYDINSLPEFDALMTKYFPGRYDSTVSMMHFIKKAKYSRDSTKDYTEAEKNFKKAISIDENDPRAYIGLSKSYALSGDIKNSIAYFEDGLKKGWNSFLGIDKDPGFNNIRSTPEYKGLMKKYFPDQYKE